ncbi:MAG: GAF domain-containing protein [Chloroflexi bacterium]|nr:GAF domain-containing protein [Chloroflexota bacterium]
MLADESISTQIEASIVLPDSLTSDENKTKQELIDELREMRQRVAELVACEARPARIQEDLRQRVVEHGQAAEGEAELAEALRSINERLAVSALEAKEAAEREQALREEIQESLAHMNTLVRISTQVLAENTMEGVLQRIVGAALTLTDARIGVSGHGSTDGPFTIGMSSNPEGVGHCPIGETFAVNQGGVYLDLIENVSSIRLTDEELREHPSWWGLPSEHVSLRGLLGARLFKEDGKATGLIMVSDKRQGDFTEMDEALLTQLAALASLRFQQIEARNAAERRAKELDAVLWQLPSGVIIAEAPSGKIILGSERVGDIWRQPFVPLTSIRQYDNWEGFHPEDSRPYTAEEWPLARSITTGEIVIDEDIDIIRGDGTRGTISLSSAPVRDDEGRIVAGVVVFTDITERKEVDRLREEYVSLVSHDLRNPLASIMGYAQLVRRLMVQKGLEQETASADSILESARRMNAMIQDLVESSHLESGRLEMRKEVTDILHLACEINKRLSPLEDQTRVRVVCPVWVPPVAIDSNRIERALMNLITNALKYSPTDAPVVVQIRPGDGWAIVSVSDEGIGISPEDLPHLFQRFYRAKTGKKTQGLGLGLYIARLIVEAHGGRVWVDSKPNGGSTFSFTLPFA